MPNVRSGPRFSFDLVQVEPRVDPIRKVKSPQWACVKTDNATGERREICRGISESSVARAVANERGRTKNIRFTRED